MSSRDLIQIAIGFLLVGIFVTLAILFPTYGIQNPETRQKEFVHRPIWDPPLNPIGHNYQNMSPQKLEELMANNPATRNMIERWKAAPEGVPVRAVFITSIHTEDKNTFGLLAFSALAFYVVFVANKVMNRG